jgi:hypothetical protein
MQTIEVLMQRLRLAVGVAMVCAAIASCDGSSTSSMALSATCGHPGAKGNALGVGAYCTASGGQCTILHRGLRAWGDAVLHQPLPPRQRLR